MIKEVFYCSLVLDAALKRVTEGVHIHAEFPLYLDHIDLE